MKFKINLADHYKKYFMASLAVIIAGVIAFVLMGFNLDISFYGGTKIEVQSSQVVDNEALASDLASFQLNQDIIALGGDGKGVLIKTAQVLDDRTRQAITALLIDKYGVSGEDNIQVGQISPTIGAETIELAVKSVIIAAVGMLIYITVRFEWKFGVAAVIALVHDVLIVMTFYVIFRIPVGTPFIAAILTVVGYSINDTIVVFDRIRDTIKYAKTSNNFKIAEDSIQQTLRRSINTSFTTLLVIGALYLLGVTSIKELALPLLVGVAVGTYSSIFIASPLWILLKDKLSGK